MVSDRSLDEPRLVWLQKPLSLPLLTFKLSTYDPDLTLKRKTSAMALVSSHPVRTENTEGLRCHLAIGVSSIFQQPRGEVLSSSRDRGMDLGETPPLPGLSEPMGSGAKTPVD